MWTECRKDLPPDSMVVYTKIDNWSGVQEERPLRRVGGGWYLPEDPVPATYPPTHWRYLEGPVGDYFDALRELGIAKSRVRETFSKLH